MQLGCVRFRDATQAGESKRIALGQNDFANRFLTTSDLIAEPLPQDRVKKSFGDSFLGIKIIK